MRLKENLNNSWTQLLLQKKLRTKKQLKISHRPQYAVLKKPMTNFIDLKAVLNSDPNLTSKNTLLPFLKSKDFKTPEVICDHIPKWFHEEYEKQGFQSIESKHGENEYKVTISIK